MIDDEESIFNLLQIPTPFPSQSYNFNMSMAILQEVK